VFVGNGHIPRLQTRLKVTDVCRNRSINVVPYDLKSGSGLTNVMLSNIRSLQFPVLLPPVTNLSLLWHMYGLRPAHDVPRPNWSGYMQTVCVGPHAPVAKVCMLPIVDLKPSDESCIYSTLLYVIEQTSRLNQQAVPCVTFDQPLYIKAVDIATAADLSIVCRLGGFHTLMNFLGAIGYVMKGSGIEELLGLLYGPSTVDHVMSGKAFARALRGHFIIHDCLMQLLLQYVVSDESQRNGSVVLQVDGDCPLDVEDVDIIQLYSSVWKNKVDVSDCSSVQCTHLQGITDALLRLKVHLALESRTARLWLQYMDYVDVVKLFVVAERTSDWCLHLTACTRMLNLFAASGHYNYAKACRVYVQQMNALPHTHPTLYGHFANGRHSIRRSHRLWAGLSCDLVIEQTLMKSVKSRGGLTHGRGMHETVRQIWTTTMSTCAAIHFAMSSLTGLDHSATEHVEVGAARNKRDSADTAKVKDCLVDNSPFRFCDSTKLVSLFSGAVAGPDDNVTCDVAEEVGLRIHQK